MNRGIMALVLVAILTTPAISAQMARPVKMTLDESVPQFEAVAWISSRPEAVPDPRPGILSEGNTTVWLHVRAFETAVDDTANLTARGLVMNRTSIRVVVPPFTSASYPILVTRRASDASDPNPIISGNLAKTPSSHDASTGFHTTLIAIDPVSYRFVSPIPPGFGTDQWGRRLAVHVGWHTPLRFQVEVKNYGAKTSDPTKVSLFANGGILVSTTNVPALAPSESRLLDLATYRFVDHSDRASGFGVYDAEIGFSLRLAADRGEETPWRLEYADNELLSHRQEFVNVMFHGGVLAQTESTHFELGKPSWITVVAENFGEEKARNVRVDIAESPWPPAYYGPGSFVQETHYVSIDPGETARLNISFVPRVAGAHLVRVQAYLEYWTPPIDTPVNIPNPVRVTPIGESALDAKLGETRSIRFTMVSTEDLGESEIGIAVAPLDHYDVSVPLARFITADDIMKIRASASSGAMAPNAPIVVDAEVETLASGRYALIPYVRSGGNVYPATGGVTPTPVFDEAPMPPGSPMGRPGHSTDLAAYQINVAPGSVSVGLLWMPLLGIVTGFSVFWTVRWKFVR